MRVRPGIDGDYDAFARLFPELGLDQQVPDRARWEQDMLPGFTVAEHGGKVVGYAVLDTRDGAAYLSQLAVSPEARRRGVARALVAAAAERVRAVGLVDWTLHVQPENTAAIALYESVGFERGTTTTSIRMREAVLDALAERSPAVGIETRALGVGEEREIERALGMEDGSVARELGKVGRYGVVAEDRSDVVGLSVIDPAFASAYPFRVRRIEAAAVILEPVRTHLTADRAELLVALQGDADIVEQLLAAGGSIRLRTTLYRARL